MLTSNWGQSSLHASGSSQMTMLPILMCLIMLLLLSIQTIKALTFWCTIITTDGMYQLCSTGNLPLPVRHSLISVICSASTTYTPQTITVNLYVATRNMADSCQHTGKKRPDSSTSQHSVNS